MAGVPAYIVMPHTAPAIKKAAVAGYGAHIVFCEPTQEEREKTMMKVQEETGCTFIHPYDRFEIIAGQGTAALELLEEIPTVDIIMAPVGGGGLLSGTAIAAKGLKPDIQVWAGEPQNADDAFKSFYSGELHPSINPKTIADGLLTSLSELTFKAIRENADAILLAPEQLIMDALNLILQRMKIVIEPSSAVPLAALMAGPEKHWKGKKIGIILSGGNLDMAMFASQIKPD
jgi:threonine dehydratase